MNTNNNADIENNINQYNVSLIDAAEKKELYVKIKELQIKHYSLSILSNYAILILLNVITFITLKNNDVKTIDSFVIVIIADLFIFSMWYKDLRPFYN